jgi:hypothetical protein
MSIVRDKIFSIFELDGYESQSSSHSSDPQWLENLRSVSTNWRLFRGNKAFKQLSKLIGLLVSLQLCSAETVTFSIKGYDIFAPTIVEKHMNCVDMIDAVFETCMYFVEGGYLCYKHQSIKPLLINDYKIIELEEDYMQMLARWELVRNGNLYKFDQIDDSVFTEQLARVRRQFMDLMVFSRGVEREMLKRKILNCDSIDNDLSALKLSSGLRIAPFALEFFGNSGRGKSTVSDQMITMLLASQKLDISKEKRAYVNDGDKYESTWTSDKLVAVFDDFANDKPSHVEIAPTRQIIKYINNTPTYANKAELEGKGKIFIEPKLVVCTTNVKDLAAYDYSKCPYSIQRRMDFVITVRVKKKYVMSLEGKFSGLNQAAINADAKAREKELGHKPLIDDIWELDVEKAIEPDDIKATAKYAPVKDSEGKPMVGRSAEEVIQFLIPHYDAHLKRQRELVDDAMSRPDEMELCGVDDCIQLKKCCPNHPFIACKPCNEEDISDDDTPVIANLNSDTDMVDDFDRMREQIELNEIQDGDYDEQAGIMSFGYSAISNYNRVKRIFATDIDNFANRTCHWGTHKLYDVTDVFLKRWDWICLLPKSTLHAPGVKEFLYWWYEDEIEQPKLRKAIHYAYYLVILLTIFVNPSYWLIGIIVLLAHLSLDRSRMKEKLMDELDKRNDAIPKCVSRLRDAYAKDITNVCVTVGVVYMMAKVYKCWRESNSEQGSLEPKNEEEIKERDSEPNPWSQVVQRPLPGSDKSRMVPPNSVFTHLEKNLLYATIIAPNSEDRMGNVLFLCSNYLIIPNHYFEECDSQSLKLICHKENANAIGGKFTTRVDIESSYLVPNSDFRICYSPSGGSFRDIREYLPTGKIVDHPFRMFWRYKSGDLLKAQGYAIAKETGTKRTSFWGGEYSKLSINTFGGLCGALLVSDTKDTILTGFHLGGKEGTNRGCFGSITQDEVSKAVEFLQNIPGVLLSGEAGDFDPQVNGESLLSEDKLHHKSPVNYLPEDSQFEYYGSCIGASTSRSDVRETPISKDIENICGIPNIWGKPKMKPEWYGWQKALANSSNPAEPVPHALLRVSVMDYERPILELVDNNPFWQKETPLSDLDNLNGRVGQKFIDAINLNTSMGIGYKGVKRDYIIELPPTNERPSHRVFVDEIMNRINKCEEVYAMGKRNHFVAKACKKDEILPVAKEKCRIFYANPIELTWLVRKYFLPVIRLLQVNPLLSECAVGINCHSPEWQQFHDFATKYGHDTIIGGDYGKYDQKLPSQKILAALSILIDIASRMSYSNRDIKIMRAMAGDIAYALIAYNGDLMGIQSGTHISGNSLTVIINGICGSLNLRDYFYTQYPASVSFRDAVNLMTYGDDNIGSVHPDYDKFNIAGASKFLEHYGQTYTMPDKESALQDYLPYDDFEFLKRKSVYHSDLGLHIGALAEKSIFKSLHCYLRPKGCPLTPAEACAQNIDMGLQEWFNHGRNVYEERRMQMQEVAKRHQLDHMCRNLDVTYDSMVEIWKYKYANGPKPQVEAYIPDEI